MCGRSEDGIARRHFLGTDMENSKMKLFAFPAMLLGSIAAVGLCSHATAQTAPVAVGSQYDLIHVYLTAGDVDRFVASFLGTFRGSSRWRI